MKILRLVINSFGNLRGKIVDFSEDTNVIMGTDEETINTVEKFIDGMLFGLSNEDKKKYRPMRLPYTGTLVFENDTGDQLQIDRNFLNDSFSVIDTDGNNVTEDYTDEFGSFALLPETDSIFAKETIKVPEVDLKDQNKLKDLKKRKRTLSQRYNIDNLIKERDELAERIKIQKALESELKENQEAISRNEEQIQMINNNSEAQENEINKEIVNLKSQLQQVNLEINKLRDKSNSIGTGKGQILKRDVRNADQRVARIDEKLKVLEEEERTFQDKLDELKGKFTVDRQELKNDFDIYQRGLEPKIRETDKEPLVAKLMDYSTWLYGTLILLGILVIVLALYNPNDYLTRPPIYFISFISVFVVLSSCVIIYLQYKNQELVPLTESAYQPSAPSEEIIKKYNMSSSEEFEKFFNDYKQIYNGMDSLEAEIDDIKSEIADAKQEKEEILAEEHELSIELTKNRVSYENKETENKIFELTQQRNEISSQIDKLVEERKNIQDNSVWKLRESSYMLNEKNKELLSQTPEEDLYELEDQYNKIQRKIDHYNEKVSKIDEQIEKIESSSETNRINYINSFATPGEADYDEKLAQQFNFGLQHNLKNHQDVPYITTNPFSGFEELSDNLMDKFKLFIENNQTLIFTSELDDLDRLRSNRIKYNGIFIK